VKRKAPLNITLVGFVKRSGGQAFWQRLQVPQGSPRGFPGSSGASVMTIVSPIQLPMFGVWITAFFPYAPIPERAAICFTGMP